MNKQPANQYVTVSIFKKETSAIQSQFAGVNDRFDQMDKKFDRFAAVLTKIDQRLDNVEHILSEKMVTKTEFQSLKNSVDFLNKAYLGFNQEEIIQSHQLKEARQQIADHELRLRKLESTGD